MRNMTDRIIVKAVKVDAHGNEVSEAITISDKKITHPKNASNFGYNRAEQLELMGRIQESFIAKQVVFLKSSPRMLPRL